MKYYKTVENEKLVRVGIYIVLFLGIFSDILRFPETSITLFRLLVPVSLIFLLSHAKYAKQYVLVLAVFGLITVTQYLIFYQIDRRDLQFSMSILTKFFVLYILIITIFFLVKMLRGYYGINFEKKCSNFIVYTGYGLMLITVLDFFDTIYLNSGFFGGTAVDNQNNYGCYIAALFPFLLVKFQERKRIHVFLGIVSSFGIVFLHDSKAALFGLVIISMIFLTIAFPADNNKKLFIYRYAIIICGFLGILGLIIINPKINGYSLQDTIAQPIIRVLTDNPYADYGSSIAYRTNTTLYCIKKICSTAFLGIGIGNTGVLLKNAFPNINPEYETAMNSPFLSLHNPWLECALDIGIILIVLYVFLIKYALKLYFTKRIMTQIEKIRVMYILSFPVWIMSASGIYTLYYLMVVMAFLLFADKNERIE